MPGSRYFGVGPDTMRQVYIHCFGQRSDSGLELELLQKYIFISLAIFKKNRYNKITESRPDAWLTFFSEDDPMKIMELIEAYPEFKFMYEDIYRICHNMEAVIGIFSEELKILDRNTAQLMIDEMQDELERIKNLNRLLAEQRRTDDIIKAAIDENYCRQLYEEFAI